MLDRLQTVIGLFLLFVGLGGVGHWIPQCYGLDVVTMLLPLSMSLFYVGLAFIGYEILLG